jgi:hypothetical protein
MAGSRRLELALVTGAAEVGALVAALLLVVTRVVPLPASPLDELQGWREGIDGARAAAAEVPGTRIAATHWLALGHLGWAGGATLDYVGARRCGASLYAPDPLASGAPLLVVEVAGLGEDRAALERRLGPLSPAGEAEALDGARVVRRYRYWRRAAIRSP